MGFVDSRSKQLINNTMYVLNISIDMNTDISIIRNILVE